MSDSGCPPPVWLLEGVCEDYYLFFEVLGVFGSEGEAWAEAARQNDLQERGDPGQRFEAWWRVTSWRGAERLSLKVRRSWLGTDQDWPEVPRWP